MKYNVTLFTLKMSAIRFSEILIDLYLTTSHYVPEEINYISARYKNVWWNGGMAPSFLTSAIDIGEW
jgi:hypothetical protein